MAGRVRLLAVQEEVLAAAAASSPQPVFGYARADEGLIQVLSASSVGTLQQIGVVHPTDQTRDVVELRCGGRSVFLELNEGIPAPTDIEVVEVGSELESRRVDVVSSDIGRKHIACFGAGSLGSMIATLLAEAGVGMFTLVDNDVLGATNVTRHVCDLFDVGRAKPVAVADAIARRGVRARPVIADVLALPESELRGLIGDVDLVVASMDSPAAQFVVNDYCVATRTSLLAVAAYERACGGEIIVVRPGTGPCLYCSIGFRSGTIAEGPLKERRKAYQAADTQALIAEPGLAVDITYLASMAAAYALALLEPKGSREALVAPSGCFTLAHGGSVPRGTFDDLFHSPFDLVHARVTRSTRCPVCGFTSTPEE